MTASPTFSFPVLGELLAILAASAWCFARLTRQWTSDRPRAALDEWARDRRFRRQPTPGVPPALQGLGPLEPVVDVALVRGPITVVRLTTAGRPVEHRSAWHVVVRTVDHAWSPAGLRPATAPTSILDLFALNGYPSLLPPERFVACATDVRDARPLASSSARGLLPADIGLLLHGPHVTLDFSARPFDGIEFDRMLAILDQLVPHLPV